MRRYPMLAAVLVAACLYLPATAGASDGPWVGTWSAAANGG